MINKQLSDYIKYQLSKGIDRESIIKDLTQSGLDNNSIQEVFSTLDSENEVKEVVSNKAEEESVVSGEQLKPKGNKIKKIFKIILYIFIAIEILNFGSYVVMTANKKINPPEVDYFMPSSIRYRPFIIQVIYGFFPSLDSNSCKGCDYKPVIYLYPTKIENIKIELDYKGKLIADYPTYDYSIKGWNVTAYPDGKIIDNDGKEYSYIFWEGEPSTPVNYDLSTGFIVKGEDTVRFLQDTLIKMGLVPKEYNEFIVYWYPRMKDNKYNLIHFADKQYTETAPLKITPKPDSMIRIFMVFKPLNKKIVIEPQEIKPFVRRGFSLVEWGGTEIEK